MKAVSEKVIQQTPDPIERPPGGGRSGHRTGRRSRGCGYSKQSGCNSTEENFRLLAIPTDLKNRGMQER